MSLNRRERRKKRRQPDREFQVFPSVEIEKGDKLPRIAIVDWGRGRSRKYRLEHLTHSELHRFWRMNNAEKAVYLKEAFNRHHRKPRCQKGPTEPDNLSYVDIVSHKNYNELIFVVAKWSSLSVERVHTVNISKFLLRLYPHLEKLFTNRSNGRLRSLEDVMNGKNLVRLSPSFVANVAKWSGISFGKVRASHIRRFISHIYPPLKRLAFDHEANRLKNLTAFTRLLNKIWLPQDEQIKRR